MRSAADSPFELPSADTVPWSPPVADTFTEPWWDACRHRRLMVRHCNACGRSHFPPRPACPSCWSDDVVWRDVSGRGVLYSYSVVHENDALPFSTSLPYAVAVVELDEGPRMMTTIVDSPPSVLAVDAPVEVVFIDRDGWTFPAFRVAGVAG